MELRDCEMDGEIARLARWCDGGAGACVVPKNKGFRDKNRHKVPQREQEWHHAKRVDRERKGRECGGLIVGDCKDGGQSHQAMRKRREMKRREKMRKAERAMRVVETRGVAR